MTWARADTSTFYPARRRARFIALLCGVSLLWPSCSGDPEASWEPREDQITSIAQLKLLYEGYPRRIDRETYIRGRVISSDRDGNIRKSIIVEDATGGIEVRVALDDAFRHYPRGGGVTIRCNTLTIGSYGGSLQLGDTPAASWETDPIRPEKLPSHIQRSPLPQQDVEPHMLTFQELSARYVNCWVRFDGVEFVATELPLTWGDPAADTDRHLVDRQGNVLIVRINSASVLSGIPLPQGSGSIEGILTYFNKSYQLRPLDGSWVSMRQPRF